MSRRMVLVLSGVLIADACRHFGHGEVWVGSLRLLEGVVSFVLVLKAPA